MKTLPPSIGGDKYDLHSKSLRAKESQTNFTNEDNDFTSQCQVLQCEILRNTTLTLHYFICSIFFEDDM